MTHQLDYQNYDHLCRLRNALKAGKHQPLKSIFPNIVRMNTWREHSDGYSSCGMPEYKSYHDFLRRCWAIHQLVGDSWEARPPLLREDWSIQHK